MMIISKQVRRNLALTATVVSILSGTVSTFANADKAIAFVTPHVNRILKK
jgi:hypothetical protein